jgi:hypothetical protein
VTRQVNVSCAAVNVPVVLAEVPVSVKNAAVPVKKVELQRVWDFPLVQMFLIKIVPYARGLENVQDVEVREIALIVMVQMYVQIAMVINPVCFAVEPAEN